MKFNSVKTVYELAQIIGAEIIGDPNHVVTGMNEIHRVITGDLTFVDFEKYYKKALDSAATTILINKKVECPKGKALLFSDDPFRDFVKLSQHFMPFTPSSEMISKSANIGKNTIIQPNVFIGHQVVIGENCLIHPNVTIYDNTIIGNNVIIHAGTVIGSDAFYYKRRPEKYDKFYSSGRVVIEDDVEIGANCTIDKGVTSDTIIGKGTKIDNLIQIGHDTVIGQNCLFAAQVGVAGCVNIEDEVILWGQVGVNKDLTIGKKAIVGAQSGVAKSIEGNKFYFGSPAHDAKECMKELACIKQLPGIIKKINTDESFI